MPISKIAIGNPSEFGQADALKAALAEFISMLIFVFAGEGSGMAYSKALFVQFNSLLRVTLFFGFCIDQIWSTMQ